MQLGLTLYMPNASIKTDQNFMKFMKSKMCTGESRLYRIKVLNTKNK